MLCFYCFAVLGTGAEACPRCGKPTFVMTAQGRRSNTRRLNAWLPSAPGPRTMFTPPALTSLPPRVDLRPLCSPVEDQGQVGSCAANAAVGAFEYHLRKQGEAPKDLSRLFVYYNGRRMGGRINQDIGLTTGEAMAALVAFGAPPEEYWPYDPEKWATEPPKLVYDWAFQTRAKEFANVPQGEGVRGALARGFPVVFSMSIPLICYTEAATSGVLRSPTAEEVQAGVVWHVMLVVGYDLTTSEYIIRNSWGARWGDNGYCRMSFATMDARAAVAEYWILGNLGQAEVAQQSTAPAATQAGGSSGSLGSAALCFYCFAEIDARAEACPKCGTPTFVMTARGKRSNTRRLGTAMPTAPGPRTMYSPLPMATLPSKVDLRPLCSPIEDQGQVGSCAANAAVGAFEYHLRKQGAAPIDLSRLFVYYNGRRIGGRLTQDIGLTIGEAMAALVAYGAPAEEHWPYLPEQWTTEPPKVVYEWAWQNRVKEFACVQGGEGIRSALARGFPVSFTVKLPAICFTDAATSGVLREPTVPEERGEQWGHAMLVVGYDIDTRDYIIRNSWGHTWGDKGYCRMPFSVMDKYASDREYWILGHLDQGDAPRSTAPAATAAESQSVTGLAANLREEIRAGLKKDIEDSMKDIKDRFRKK